MKLLDKRHITEDSNSLKKAQIDEGVQIARKVDALRLELANLEKQREQFFKGSKMELEKALGTLQAKKSALEGELIRAEELLREKRKPLDDEWADLFDKQTNFSKAVIKFEQEKNELSEKTTALEEEKKRVYASKSIASEEERAARATNQEAQERNEQSKGIRDATIRDAEAQRKRVDEENRKLTHREQEADGMAKALDRREKALAKREKLLNDRERFINDKYETLERTINRLKK